MKLMYIFKIITRGGGSTGAAGAFAPVNFQQRVHCTRPDEELSYKWLYFSLKMSFLSPKLKILIEVAWLPKDTQPAQIPTTL